MKQFSVLLFVLAGCFTRTYNDKNLPQRDREQLRAFSAGATGCEPKQTRIFDVDGKMKTWISTGPNDPAAHRGHMTWKAKCAQGVFVCAAVSGTLPNCSPLLSKTGKNKSP